MENVVEVKSRPTMASVICIYYFLSTGYTITKLTLVSSGLVKLDSFQKSLYGSPTDQLLIFITACLVLSAAVALFRLRRIAVNLFCIPLALTMLISLWRALTQNSFSAAGIRSLIGFGAAWTTMLSVCIYAARLRAKGILR